MPPRLHVDTPLAPGAELALPPNATRHVQVLRLQPGDALTLFDGQGGQWQAEVLAMGRREVTARAIAHEARDLELPQPVTLAPGMPANERMDTLIEKATELGAAAIVPLMTERSVLRVAGERAERKAAHWQAVAVSACEQSGRNRVPAIAAPQPLAAWLPGALAAAGPGARGLQLSLDATAPPLRSLVDAAPAGTHWVLLSGPEGGLSPAEQQAAARAGFAPVSLGPRVLRADTAPLAALAVIAALAAGA
ncbi:16S rRNA (uracil(1498)-N(3))-methyltransferase [Aquabacterium sp. OR-4]|uniref:16S rRNA (uracil(1498)-N(3))-methyltransferase n=1 Tax=Aquabacterium sp. OR-4 TaxID=2978127 RepID=UPI0021B2FE23|nr:16S rRNA (uracil(1498)-N(3))-methyltransferase [Aquabacterium sp. OR-4]MDT7833980.1 16S rRNA (uracil(1498)-N(3))-methyltransferase [Aquabacterium sp. OR-4]